MENGDAPSMFAAASRDLDISSLLRMTLDEKEVTHDTSGTTINPSEHCNDSQWFAHLNYSLTRRLGA